jgi:hypothetical protein
MSSLEIAVDAALLRKARQYADERGTTLEALLAEHLGALADRAGRRLTVREEVYRDHRPPDEVVEVLRAEGLGGEGKTQTH